MNVLVFDIETIPDIQSAKAFHGLSDYPDADAKKALLAHAHVEMGDFYPLVWHKVVAISVLLQNDEGIRLWSLGHRDASEAELITRFFEGLDKLKPTLVSWNGGGFDLPVLHYRAMRHHVVASTYWDKGQKHAHFRWDHYTNRYHERHLDLMDKLACFQPKAYAKLDHVAQSLGLPGKSVLSGDKVEAAYHAGQIDDIRAYCEMDVLNTYLVYLRFEMMRGHMTPQDVEAQHTLVREHLKRHPCAHYDAFLEAWG